jgi:hypothetical protein
VSESPAIAVAAVIFVPVATAATAIVVIIFVVVVASTVTSEVQNKMIFMGHQITSCHVPVVRSFFISWKMLLSS